MSGKKEVIYGVKSTVDNQFYYIGKVGVNASKNSLVKSDIRTQYVNNNLREVIKNNVSIEKIQEINPSDKWYDEKILEVHRKYLENHPLINSEWLCKGYRGYWQGKKRDSLTITRLSESKFKRVCQYNEQGDLVKIWDSAKEPAEKIFGDYVVIRGSAESQIYDRLQARSIRGRYAKASYWFYYEDILKYFTSIPVKININALKKAEHDKRSLAVKNEMATRREKNLYKRYMIIQTHDDGSESTYMNSSECAFRLKISKKSVENLCLGKIAYVGWNLRYGEKVLQEKITYPHYEVQQINKIALSCKKQLAAEARLAKKLALKKHVEKLPRYVPTQTRTSVDWYVDGVLKRRFDDVQQASEYWNKNVGWIYRICRGCGGVGDVDLRFGEKIKKIKHL